LHELCASLDGIVRHMLSADHSGQLPEFVRWSRAQDRHRGQNTAEVLPELQPLFQAETNRPAAPVISDAVKTQEVI